MENKKISELIPDNKNFNKGTEEGQKLLNESFKDYGAGRSILLDKNGKIIAGNKSTLAAIEAGIENVKIIEVDGSELVAVKRKDVDIDSEKGRKLALLDNLTSQVNLAWDEQMLHSVADELEDFDISKFGFEEPTAEPQQRPEEKELKPFDRNHILISYPIDLHDEVIACIENLFENKNVKIIQSAN